MLKLGHFYFGLTLEKHGKGFRSYRFASTLYRTGPVLIKDVKFSRRDIGSISVNNYETALGWFGALKPEAIQKLVDNDPNIGLRIASNIIQELKERRILNLIRYDSIIDKLKAGTRESILNLVNQELQDFLKKNQDFEIQHLIAKNKEEYQEFNEKIIPENNNNIRSTSLALKKAKKTNNTDMIKFFEKGNTVRKSVVQKFLKEIDVKINAKDNLGKKALTKAAQLGYFDIVQSLIKEGANISDKDNYGYNALMHAAKMGHFDIAKFLIENGADIHDTNKNFFDQNALIFAAQEGNVDILNLLINKGAIINYKDKLGKTALMYAAQGGHVNAMKFLIENGADKNIKDNDDKTALMYAEQEGHFKIENLLKESTDKNIIDIKNFLKNDTCIIS